MVAPDDARVGPVPAAVAGAVAAGVALGVSELVTGITGEGPSLVSAVGTEFIDRFAGSLKDFAVSLFGTNDKPALVVGIVIVSMFLGALFGVVAAWRFWIGAAGLVLGGSWACGRTTATRSARRASGSPPPCSPSAAGVSTLRLLPRRRADGRGRRTEPSRKRPQPPPTAGTRAGHSSSAPRALGAGAAASAALGRRLRSSEGAESARRAVTIPRPASVQTVPASQPFTVPGLSPYVTPNDDFYRIDTALELRRRSIVDSWRLACREWSTSRSRSATTSCSRLPRRSGSSPCSVSPTKSAGPSSATRCGRASRSTCCSIGPASRRRATQIVGRSVDRWTAGFPTELVRDGRVAMVAYAMNGQPLPVAHGFPARLDRRRPVRVRLGHQVARARSSSPRGTASTATGSPRGWAKQGPIKTASRIDVPRLRCHRSRRSHRRGRRGVGADAWHRARRSASRRRRVAAVPLGDVASDNTWVQWVYEWDAAPGDHVLTVRATDGDGQTQTSETQPPIPDGATGRHSRRVRVDGST